MFKITLDKVYFNSGMLKAKLCCVSNAAISAIYYPKLLLPLRYGVRILGLNNNDTFELVVTHNNLWIVLNAAV